jgi:hypothetical protein
MMRRYQFLFGFIFFVLAAGCSDGDELLDNFTKDGPIVYAGRIDSLKIQSGYYRVKVNIFPSEDVNRSFCILQWNKSDGLKDSVRIDYADKNFDQASGCYFTYIDLDSIEGNLLIESQNIDIFGNRSLILGQGAFVYGKNYTLTLLNSKVNFKSNGEQITFVNRLRAVGNWVSYEKNDGSFTPDSLITEDSFSLVDPKHGGIIRTKTLYLIDESDIDTLVTNGFLETAIP